MKNLSIEKVIGREILDSRGNPTVKLKSIWLMAQLQEEPLRPAHLQENLKHWSFVTAIRADILEKVLQKLSTISIQRSMMYCMAWMHLIFTQ